MVFTDNFTPTTATSSPCHEPDDISAFLRHLIHRSSASNTSTTSSSIFLPNLPTNSTVGLHAGKNNNNNENPPPCFLAASSTPTPSSAPPVPFYGLDRVLHRSFNNVGPSSSPLGYFAGTGGSHLSSNNDYNEDCDYESEEGAEAVADETEAEAGTRQSLSQSRNHSKRIRAAEVHNLSEKRRRSRINEKMKALQNLIPNSNKTDKASMLDEAIEYLKQLQLQVQMLSMRNGLSLHPMCLPEEQSIMHATQLSEIGMHNNLNNNNTPFDHISMSSSLNIIPDTSHSIFNNLANRPSSSTRPSLPGVSNVINSETTRFGIDSVVQPSFRPLQTQIPNQSVCREQSLPQERLLSNKQEMKSLVAPSFGAGNLVMEGNHNHNPHEAQTPTNYGSQGLLLENILGQNPSNTSNIYSGLRSVRSNAQNDKLTIGR